MLQFDDVELTFSGQTLFQGASFTLQKGERCGLVGRNGAGKSTLIRLITGEMEPDSGTVSIPKHYRLGYLQQHIQFKEETLLEEAALGLLEDEKDDLYKAEAILFGLGFTEDDLVRPPTHFSGGFQLRLHLAQVLLARPHCLLLDEPTNYLDIVSMRWLKQFLSRWQGEFILISHDREFMDSVTTHTMGIHRGKLKKIKGSSIDFFEQILQEEELHEKTRMKSEKKRAHLQSYVDRFGAKASKASQAQSKVKMMERIPVLEKLNALSELAFNFQEAHFPGKKMLTAEGLHFSYTEEPLIENVSLEIEKGERIAIIGKNGRGKSTLLQLLSGDLTPRRGRRELSSNTCIGYFGQTHIERLNHNHSIEEEIALANPRLNYTEIKGIAGAMLFSGSLSNKKIGILSGGERSRVLLGKIVAHPCSLLLLDEPTHHLDIESIEALMDALEEFSGSIVIVTHSELILRRLHLHKIIHCEEAKQTVFWGSYDDFLEKVGWEKPVPKQETFQLDKEIRILEKELAALEEKQKNGQDRQRIDQLEERLCALYDQRKKS